MHLCVDCMALDVDVPLMPTGRAERCDFHWLFHERWRWKDSKRKRDGRKRTPYKPIPAPTLPGVRWLTEDEAERLTDLLREVAFRQNDIAETFRTKGPLEPHEVAQFTASVGKLVKDLGGVLERDERRAPRNRRPGPRVKPK